MTILANRCLDIIVDFGLLGTLWRCFMLRSEFSKGCTKAKTTSSMMYFPDQSFKNWSTSQNFSNPGSVNLWHHGGEQFWAIDRWVILFKCRFFPGKCWQHVCPSYGYHHLFPSGYTPPPFLAILVWFPLGWIWHVGGWVCPFEEHNKYSGEKLWRPLPGRRRLLRRRLRARVQRRQRVGWRPILWPCWSSWFPSTTCLHAGWYWNSEDA